MSVSAMGDVAHNAQGGQGLTRWVPQPMGGTHYPCATTHGVDVNEFDYVSLDHAIKPMGVTASSTPWGWQLMYPPCDWHMTSTPWGDNTAMHSCSQPLGSIGLYYSYSKMGECLIMWPDLLRAPLRPFIWHNVTIQPESTNMQSTLSTYNRHKK